MPVFADPPSAGPKPKHDWAAIRTDYQTNRLSLEELARKHDVSFSTVMKRSAKEQWSGPITAERRAAQRLASKATTAIVRKMEETAVMEGKKAASSISAFLADSLAKGQLLAEVAEMTIRRDLDDRKAYRGEPAELASLAGVTKIGVGIGRQALGLEDGGQGQQRAAISVGTMSVYMDSRSHLSDGRVVESKATDPQ